MSSKGWSFLFLFLFLQCWLTHLLYCNVLRRWHWDRGFIAHFRCPRLSEKVAKIAKVFYSECFTLTLQMWAPLVNFQLTLFCLIFTSELSKGLMFKLLSALWIFEKKKLSQSMTPRLNSKVQENKNIRIAWDLFGRQHFSFGLRSNVLWVEDQTVWSPHLERLHHQPSRPIWSVKDLIKELLHSHCISGIMRPLKTLSVCTFLPNRNNLSEVILITALLIASSTKSGCVERCNPHFLTLELSFRPKID